MSGGRFLSANSRLETQLNYRHAFHAGNFADLVKHGALLHLLARLTRGTGPLTVIDTHAGAGLYDLAGPEALRSGEAAAGVARLMAAADAPVAFAPLKAAVAGLNGAGAIRRYPGSPWLIAQALRPADRYLACELRPEEHRALAQTLKGRKGVEALCADGYKVALDRLPAKGPALVLIDPPFERADDYSRIVETVKGARRRNREAVAMVWLPLKDLETFDAFLRDLEDAGAGALLVGETRMRPLSDPMKMNGCALVFANPPADLQPLVDDLCGWTAQALGEKGAGRAWRLGVG